MVSLVIPGSRLETVIRGAVTPRLRLVHAYR